MTDQEYLERRMAEFDAENQRKIQRYRELNQAAKKGATVCAGSSLMELFPLNELLMSAGSTKTAYNRGVAGYTIDQYDKVLDACVLELEPSKLIINIGSNDLNRGGDTIENLIRGYRALLLRIKEALPECRITLLAYYPCRKPRPEDRVLPGRIARTLENINEANRRVEVLAKELGCGFADISEPLKNEEGYLREDYAVDAIHFSPTGYAAILPLLEPLL